MSGTEQLATILGGVTMLLWGARMVRTGILRGYGAALQAGLGACTSNRLYAVFAGTFIGSMLQSSTATALLAGPYVARGVLTTAAGLAIMLGADLGSAIAASVFSSGVARAWPVLALSGYILHLAYDGRNVQVKSIGRVLLGLGILFLGLSLLGSTAAGLASSKIVPDIISATASEPVLAVLTGAALTLLAYSSIAIVLLAVTLAGSAGVGVEQLYTLILGINLGAALPALSAMSGQSPASRRIPLGNLIFRTVAVLATLPFIGWIAQGIGGFALNDGLKLLVFHLGFNAVLCVVGIGFTGALASLLAKLLPDAAKANGDFGPRYLDDGLLATPSAALGAASRETLRMGEVIEEMLVKTMQVFEKDDPSMRAEVAAADDRVDELNEAIKLYLTRLLRDELSDQDSAQAIEIITYTTNLEHVGDIIDKNLMELAEKKRRQHLKFSPNGLNELRNMHARVVDTLHLSLNVFTSGQADSARMLIARKDELRSLELEGTQKHIQRLSSGQSESILTSGIHLDVLRDFKRINSHLTSVAYPVLETAGELRATRLKKKAQRQMLANHANADSNL